VIKILQGSVFTQIMLGELTIHPPVANFLYCISTNNNMKVGRQQTKLYIFLIATINRLPLLVHPVYTHIIVVLILLIAIITVAL